MRSVDISVCHARAFAAVRLTAPCQEKHTYMLFVSPVVPIAKLQSTTVPEASSPAQHHGRAREAQQRLHRPRDAEDGPSVLPLTHEPRLTAPQVDASISAEPDHRARIIKTLNDQSAAKRTGLVVRLPQPAPGHCLYTQHVWTDDEVATYTTSGKLPRDLTTLDHDSNSVLLFVFDVRGCGGRLPEVRFEWVPDLRAQPALCAFDMDGRGKIALIPSEFLEMVETGSNKVQFRLNERGRGGGRATRDGKDGEEDQQSEKGEDGGGQTGTGGGKA